MSPVINFNATRNENHAAAGGGPDGQGDGQHDQQQLLANNQEDKAINLVLIQTSIMPTSCVVTTKSVLLFIM